MRTIFWRPSTALRKRQSTYLSILDATGIAGIFCFLVALYSGDIGSPDHHLLPSVDLPTTAHPQSLPGAIKEVALSLCVGRDGSVYFATSRVRNAELPQLLRDAYRKGSERKVYLRADARAKYGDVKKVLDQISAAGIRDVAFITEGQSESKH
jgi:biopolymer transport protein ExbD